MGRRLALLPLVVTAALAWPAASWAAASGSLVGGVMDYQGGSDSNQATLQLVDRGAGGFVYQVVDQPAVSITPAAPCFNDNNQQNVMDCPADGGFTAVPVTKFTASLGDGDDKITLLADLPTSIGAGGGADTMNGGPAADFLRGGQQNDTITGGGGNDQLVGDDPGVAGGGNDALDGGTGNDALDGQDGADTVTGGDGDDVLNGGGGNDRLLADQGRDDLNGGDGVDVADYSARALPQFLSIDGVPNDGQDARVDNIATDVENLIGGSAGDTMSGSDQPNNLDGGPGDDSIDGQAGDDVVTGGAGNDDEHGGDGNDLVDGGAGDDLLDGGLGPDVIDGGDGLDTGDYSSRSAGVAVSLDDQPGDGELGEGDNVRSSTENLRGGSGGDTFIGSPAANNLDGGAGEDYSDGGAGADTLVGGDAGDVMRTRGNADPDTVRCGPGPDFVVAKPNDVVDPDCDRVDRGVSQKPKRRDSAVVTPVGGALQMSPAGIVRRVPLQDKVVLPLRSIVDTAAGTAKVTSAPTSRKSETVLLEDGAFDITQTTARRAVTQFALQGGDFSACPTAAGRRASAAAASKKSSTKAVRLLWANGKGSFRTKGRYAAATVRGTNWETVDRCDGTLIRVRRGAVSMRDLVKKKTVVVKAGQSYLAKR